MYGKNNFVQNIFKFYILMPSLKKYFFKHEQSIVKSPANNVKVDAASILRRNHQPQIATDTKTGVLAM